MPGINDGSQAAQILRLENDVRDLQRKLDVVMARQETMDEDMYNGGKEGMKTKLNRIETELTTTDRVRKEDHAENKEKLDTIMSRANWLLALLGFFIALLGVVLTYEKLHEHSLLHRHPLHTIISPELATHPTETNNSIAYAQAEKR